MIIVGSMSLIGLIDNFIPIIAEYTGVWQFHMVRSTIACTIVIAFCLIRKQSIMPKRFWPVFMRSIFIASAMILYFGSLALMPVAEAGAALFSSPIFIILFSILLFGTRVGVWRTLAVLVGFAGVLMILKPDPADLSPMTFVPLLAGSLYALSQIFTRHYCYDENTATVLLGFLLVIGLFGLIGTIVLSIVEVPQHWLESAGFFFTGWTGISREFLVWTAVQASGSIIAVAGLIRGYQIAEPTLVAVFEYSFLLFAGFWGWLLWDQFPDMVSILGIICIVVAGCTIVYRVARKKHELSVSR